MQFYHKCEKTVTGTLCSGIVVHYGQNTQPSNSVQSKYSKTPSSK